jgi:hypothetical protein
MTLYNPSFFSQNHITFLAAFLTSHKQLFSLPQYRQYTSDSSMLPIMEFLTSRKSSLNDWTSVSTEVQIPTRATVIMFVAIVSPH